MTPRLAWTRPQCDTLLQLVAAGATIRQIATKLGISRSAVSRQHIKLVADGEADNATRSAHGAEPLPPGHPTSWTAISATDWPEQRRA